MYEVASDRTVGATEIDQNFPQEPSKTAPNSSAAAAHDRLPTRLMSHFSQPCFARRDRTRSSISARISRTRSSD